jgi:hypothetical protein
MLIGMPNVTHRPWSIGRVEFAVNRHAFVRAAELALVAFVEIIWPAVQMQVWSSNRSRVSASVFRFDGIQVESHFAVPGYLSRPKWRQLEPRSRRARV